MLHDIRRTLPKLRSRLEFLDSLVYRRVLSLPNAWLLTLEGAVEDPLNVSETDGVEVAAGESWGKPEQHFILEFDFRVPDDWINGGPTALYLPIGQAGDFSHPEATVFLDQVRIGACDRHHQEIVLPPSLDLAGRHSLVLYGWTGIRETPAWVGGGSPTDAQPLVMGECGLVQIDEPLQGFIALARVALGVVEKLSEIGPARAHLLSALNGSFLALDTRHPIGERFYQSVATATERLHSGIEAAGEPMSVDLYAVGHAHLDLAWLWPLSQTRQKARRTSLNVLGLMERWPEFHFVQSQPQLYEFVRQDDPELFDAIRARVEEGRWEPIGGMWVEADCNLSGPEALARQFVLGRNYFRQHFGPEAESPVLWLPDVFGFPANLPQLASQAGIRYFFTAKLGWSQYNRIPYDSFWWRGLDGTELLTHFGTARSDTDVKVSNYNARATPEELHNAWSNYQQKDWGAPGQRPLLLMPYGHGDGGGGPTAEMAANLEIMHNFPATPEVRQSTAIDFFRQLEEQWGDRLPTWDGELYLEYHQGTYTTQARNKVANRQSEFLLHDAELLICMARVLTPSASPPTEELKSAWQLLCLNQFHDILPGSSIGRVHTEAMEQYEQIAEIGARSLAASSAAVAEHFDGEPAVVNPTSFARSDLAIGGRDFDVPGLIRSQRSENGQLMDVGITPALSVSPFSSIYDRSSENDEVSVTESSLENDQLLIELDDAGDLARIYDKRHSREALEAGSVANQLQAFEDRPSIPDAWDTEAFFDDRMWLVDPAESIQIVESGPLRGAIEIRRRLRESLIVQRLTLERGSRRLDFVTQVEWRERHTLLKAAFPVNVHTPRATFEVPWGSVDRPTHRNTSWDWARFEVPAQKWIDLSEANYGVSLLNNGRYGHDVFHNIMRISLLRGTIRPDPNADLGEHNFTYSLLPHAGDWRGLTQAEAYSLNNPLRVIEGTARESGPEAPGWRFLSSKPSNMIVETVKPAEDGNGFVVRMYESQRKRGIYKLTAGFPLEGAWRTDLLEQNVEQLAIEDRTISGTFGPYQIVTVRLIPRLEG